MNTHTLYDCNSSTRQTDTKMTQRQNRNTTNTKHVMGETTRKSRERAAEERFFNFEQPRYSFW